MRCSVITCDDGGMLHRLIPVAEVRYEGSLYRLLKEYGKKPVYFREELCGDLVAVLDDVLEEKLNERVAEKCREVA